MRKPLWTLKELADLSGLPEPSIGWDLYGLEIHLTDHLKLTQWLIREIEKREARELQAYLKSPEWQAKQERMIRKEMRRAKELMIPFHELTDLRRYSALEARRILKLQCAAATPMFDAQGKLLKGSSKADREPKMFDRALPILRKIWAAPSNRTLKHWARENLTLPEHLNLLEKGLARAQRIQRAFKEQP